VLVDRFGPLRTGLLCQCAVMLALLLALVGEVSSAGGLYLLAAALGVAGTSMAVAIPLSSPWYPDEHQGLALGVAGMASSGTVLTALLAPWLAEAYGWRNVLGLAVIPLFAVLFLYLLLAKESPRRPPPQRLPQYLKVLAEADAWWFMLLYAVAFGGVVAFASILVLYFHQQYRLPPVTAGYLAAACVLAGSVLRPVGGWMADRFGGIRSLQIFFLAAAVVIAALGLVPPTTSAIAMGMLLAAAGALGMGSGAVFQLVPLRFRHEVGAATGLIGMAGGLGGFALAQILGQSKLKTQGYSAGFLLFAGLAVLCVIGIWAVKRRWRTTWGSANATSARV
jgi:NNP family nitrate/nitrite transporter-like MFS transporter